MYLYNSGTLPHQPLKSISKVAFMHRFHCSVTVHSSYGALASATQTGSHDPKLINKLSSIDYIWARIRQKKKQKKKHYTIDKQTLEKKNKRSRSRKDVFFLVENIDMLLILPSKKCCEYSFEALQHRLSTHNVRFVEKQLRYYVDTRSYLELYRRALYHM